MSRMGEDLMEAMQEMMDHAAGKMELRTSRYTPPIVAPVCETITVEEIKETRKTLGVTQSAFAVILGVSQKTVESWEAGRYSPDGAARRLIMVMQSDPSFPEKYGIVQR